MRRAAPLRSPGTWTLALALALALGLGGFSPAARADDAPAGNQLHAALVALRDGGLLAVWLDARSGEYHVRSSRSSPPTLAWPASVQVDAAPYGEQGPPSVAAGPGDQVLAAWAGRSGEQKDVYLARSRDGGRTWGAPVGLAGGLSDAKDASIAAAGGRVVVVFTAVGSGYRSVHAASSRDWGASWSAPFRVSAEGANRVGRTAVAVQPDGSAVAAWEEGTSSAEVVMAARSADGGAAWVAPSAVDPAPNATWQVLPAALAALDGRFVLAWDEGYDIHASSSADGGATWRPSTLVLDASEGWKARPSLALGASGRIHLAWDSYYDIWTSSSDDGGASWSAPSRVDDAREGTQQRRPAVAVDPDGVVHAVWEDNRNGDYDIFSARSTPCGLGSSFCEGRCIASSGGRCCAGAWRAQASCCRDEECSDGRACASGACSPSQCAPGFAPCAGSCPQLPGRCCGGAWKSGAACCADADCPAGSRCGTDLGCAAVATPAPSTGPGPATSPAPSATPAPTPTTPAAPSATPAASAAPGASASPVAPPSPTPAPTPSTLAPPAASPTASPASSATPRPSPTPRPSSGPVPSPTAAASASPAPGTSATPAAGASPSPSASHAATPGPSTDAVRSLILSLWEEIDRAEASGALSADAAASLRQRLDAALALAGAGSFDEALSAAGSVTGELARARLSALLAQVEALAREGRIDGARRARLVAMLEAALRSADLAQDGPSLERCLASLGEVERLAGEVGVAARATAVPSATAAPPSPTPAPAEASPGPSGTGSGTGTGAGASSGAPRPSDDDPSPSTRPTATPLGTGAATPSPDRTGSSPIPAPVASSPPEGPAATPGTKATARLPRSTGSTSLDGSAAPASVPSDPLAAAVADLAAEAGCDAVCAGLPAGCAEACEDILEAERRLASPVVKERLVIRLALGSRPPPVEALLQAAWHALGDGDVAGAGRALEELREAVDALLAEGVSATTLQTAQLSPRPGEGYSSVLEAIGMLDLGAAGGGTNLTDEALAASLALERALNVSLSVRVVRVSSDDGTESTGTVVSLAVANLGRADAEEFCIVGDIPKAFAASARELTFRQDAAVLVDEPVVMWSVDRLGAGRSLELAFSLPRQADPASLGGTRVIIIKVPGRRCGELAARPGLGAARVATGGGPSTTLPAWGLALAAIALLAAGVVLSQRGGPTVTLEASRQGAATVVAATVRNPLSRPVHGAIISFEPLPEFVLAPGAPPAEALGTLPAGTTHVVTTCLYPVAPSRGSLKASLTFSDRGRVSRVEARPVAVAGALALLAPVALDEGGFEGAAAGMRSASRRVRGDVAQTLAQLRRACPPLARVYARRAGGGVVDEGFAAGVRATGALVTVRARGKQGALGGSLTIECRASDGEVAAVIADELASLLAARGSGSFYGGRYA